jgi:MFS family permease
VQSLQTFRYVARDRSLFYLCIGRAIRSFSQSYLIVVVPLYLLARGSTPAQVGVVVTFWALGAALLGTAAGFASDRYGRKSVLLAFAAFSLAGALVFYAQAPLWALAVAGALGTIGRGGTPASGGAFGPFYSAEQALIAERSPQELRTRIFALFSLFGSLGGAAGLLLTGVPQLVVHLHLGTHVQGYRVLFAVTAVASAALVAATLPVREERRPARSRQAHRGAASLSAHSRSLIGRFWITNSLNGLAIGFLGPMLVLWFHLRYGATSHEIGAIYFAVALVSTVSFLFVGRVVRAIGGSVKTIVVLRFGACALLAVMALMPTLWLAGFVYLARMILNSITMPVRQSYVMGIVEPQERSRVASLSNLPSQFFSMLGPSIAGVLLTQGWIGTMLEAAAAFQLLNGAAYWKFFGAVLPPEEQEAAPPQA